MLGKREMAVKSPAKKVILPTGGATAEFAQATKSVANALKLVASAAEAQGGLTPLLLGERTTADQFLAKWRATTPKDRFLKARSIYESNSYVRDVLQLQTAFFNKGFKVSGLEAPGYNFGQLARDVWGEFLLCDNVVAFWRDKEVESDSLPLVTIFDCEQVDYEDAFGMDRVKLTFGKSPLDAEAKKALGPRYAKALESGKPLILDREEGERWKVLKRGKRGKGLVSPRIYTVFEKLSALELLEVGDWSGAWTMKNVIRQIRKGHEIKSGQLAGQPHHFIKKEESAAILKANKNKSGAYDAVTNFDVDILYKHLDPRFFDAKKYDGILGRLAAWAGAAGCILATQQSQFVCEVFEAEGEEARGMVGPFLESILNDADFCGVKNGNAKVTFDPQAFMPFKIRLELTRMGYTNGLLSPQSAREMSGFDDKLESERLLEAHKNPEQYWPPFEAKQGYGGNPKGGRPTKDSVDGNPQDGVS